MGIHESNAVNPFKRILFEWGLCLKAGLMVQGKSDCSERYHSHIILILFNRGMHGHMAFQNAFDILGKLNHATFCVFFFS